MRLIIDISGLAYRAAHKLKLSDRKGQSTSVVYGVLRSLEHLAELVEPDEMIIAWDRGHDARSRIYPEYKGNRKRDPEFQEDMHRQMDLLHDRIFPHLPITQVAEPGCEADDVIAALCQFMRPENVGIVTGDKDLYQLASKDGQHIVIDPDGVPAKLEFKPSQYVTYKALVGDSSDNIKGVLGLGDKGVRALLKEHRTLKRIVAEAKAGRVKLGRMSYKEALPIIKRNLTLMRLDGSILTEQQRSSIVVQYRDARLARRINQGALREQLTELGFNSILKRLSRFLLHFRGMEREPGSGRANPGERAALARARHAEAKADTKSPQGEDTAGAEGRRLWRKVRRVKSRRWRKVRRVRNLVEPTEDEGIPSPLDLRAQGTDELDTQGADGSAERAVPDVVRQARLRRARGRPSGLPDDEEVSFARASRRGHALSILSALQNDPGWMREQPTGVLKRVMSIIDEFEKLAEYIPTEEEMEFLDDLSYRRSMEMPNWMLTPDEAWLREWVRKRRRLINDRATEYP